MLDHQEADRTLVRDVAAIAAAVVVTGVSFGAIAVTSGLPGWAALAMSVLVFAGGSQFMAVGMLAAASPFGAIAGGLLLNTRHLPFGLVVSDLLGSSRRARLVGSHLMVDESVAFALAQSDPVDRRRAYWLTGTVLFCAWNVGTALGVIVGEFAADPAALGLDAAFPAGLIALLFPALREPAARRVAVVGAAVAVLTAGVLPAGLPVLLALTGLAAAGRPRWPS